MLIVYVGTTALSFLAIASASQCVNGTNNKFIVSSDSKKFPITLENLEITTFDKNMKPSCANNKPNVVFPGYFHYANGRITVKKHFKFSKHTTVKVTAVSQSGTKYCVEGRSAQWFLPDSLCVYDFCEAVGESVCKLLSKPGVYTTEDMAESEDYKTDVKLPDEPCFFNALCAHDLLKGRYYLRLTIDHKGKTISRWNVPSDTKYVQFYVGDNDSSRTNDKTLLEMLLSESEAAENVTDISLSLNATEPLLDV